MPIELPASLFRESLVLLAQVGGPMFLVLLVSGVVLGVFQAATQINDPALGALPRLVVAVGVVWMMGGWIMERLAAFLVSALQRMAVKPF